MIGGGPARSALAGGVGTGIAGPPIVAVPGGSGVGYAQQADRAQ